MTKKRLLQQVTKAINLNKKLIDSSNGYEVHEVADRMYIRGIIAGLEVSKHIIKEAEI